MERDREVPREDSFHVMPDLSRVIRLFDGDRDGE